MRNLKVWGASEKLEGSGWVGGDQFETLRGVRNLKFFGGDEKLETVGGK